MRQKLCLFLFLSLIALSTRSYATSCFIPGPDERIKQNPIIFKGKVVAQKPIEDPKKQSDGYNRATVSTKFEISEVYKGDPGEVLELIQMRDPWGDAGLQPGHEYIIFTDQNLKTYYCNPFIDLSYEKNWGGAYRYDQEIAALNKMKGELDQVKTQAENEDTEKAFMLFGDALEKYRDYARAQKVYESILKRQLASANQHETWGNSRKIELTNKCSSKTNSDHAPDFLKIPDDGQLVIGLEALMRYSNSLALREKYEHALLPLCIAAEGFESKEAASLKVLTSFKLGLKDEISGGPYDLSGRVIGKMDVSGMKLSGWNFANSTVAFTAKNTDFDGANFENAKIVGEFINSKFQQANFRGAKLGGTMTASSFNGAKFNGAELGTWRGAEGNSFVGADLSGATINLSEGKENDFSKANLSAAKINGLGTAKTEGADFTGATFYTAYSDAKNSGINLSRQKLDDANFQGNILNNASFTGASLKNANFSGARLENADFGNPILRERSLTFGGLAVPRI